MVAPDYYGTQSGTGTFSFPLPRNGSVTVTGALFNSTQQRSSLEDAIPALLGVYLNPDSAQQNGFVPDYLERATSHAFTSTAGATIQWPLTSWLPLHGSFGVDHVTRNDKDWLPAGYTSDVDSLGFLQTGNGIGTTTTGMLSTLLPPLSLGTSRLTAAIGLSATRTANLTSLAAYDPVNGTLPFQLVESSRFEFPAASTVSGFVEPRLDLTSRLFVNAGVRWDQNHLSGLPNTVSAYPHIDASWIASDESALRLQSVFSLLRFRLAYGYAGTQAGMSPLVQLTNPAAASVPAGLTSLQGWIYTHPERSQEVEGGVDAGVWHDRVSLSLTAYRKRSHDMIPSPLPFAPSVGEPVSPTDFLAQNTADVQNAGLEASLTLHLLQSSLMAWSVDVTASRNDNMVQGVNSSVIQSTNLDLLGTRIVAGAPLFSRWARPIVNVVDADHNGVISSNEYQLADSAVSLGSEFPRNTVGVHTVMSFFGGRITAATTVEYEGGLSQANGAALYVSQSGTSFLGNSINAPNATLMQQAEAEAVPQTLIGVMQTVQTLRWSDLSVAYNVPLGFARRLHLGALAVAFQGSNLALHTNYHGIDPAVNALPAGYGVMDLGEVPLPRTLDLRVTVGT